MEGWEHPGPAEAKHSARKWPTVWPAGAGCKKRILQASREKNTTKQNKQNQVPYRGLGFGTLCLW